jgi:uncharacterized protein
MSEINFEQARAFVLERLEWHLSPKLFYHSLIHTRDDVVVATARLADMEGVPQEARRLLLTAAYFHDIGFTELDGNPVEDNWKRAHHEDLSVQYCERELPGFGYSPRDIEVIRGIILATKLPQAPHNLLEEIMADADLDSLGRPDFWRTSKALRNELEAFGHVVDDETWLLGQVSFLGGHSYFTSSASKLRQGQKEQNIQEIYHLLSYLQK